MTNKTPFNPNIAPPQCPPGQAPPQNALRGFMVGEYAELLKTKGANAAGQALAKFLVANNVKMIATDFDLTMTTSHTGGYILKNEIETSPHARCVSPIFNDWATYCCSLGLRFSVVTFADSNRLGGHEGIGGQDLVVANLVNCKCTFRVEKVYPYFPPLYKQRDAYTAMNLDAPMHKSKRYHLRKVCHDFNLKPWEVLLLDDARTNCTTAVEDGFLALNIDGHEGLRLESLLPC